MEPVCPCCGCSLDVIGAVLYCRPFAGAYLNDTQVFDLATGAWSSCGPGAHLLGTAATPRYLPSFATAGENLFFIFGGLGSAGTQNIVTRFPKRITCKARGGVASIGS